MSANTRIARLWLWFSKRVFTSSHDTITGYIAGDEQIVEFYYPDYSFGLDDHCTWRITPDRVHVISEAHYDRREWTFTRDADGNYVEVQPSKLEVKS